MIKRTILRIILLTLLNSVIMILSILSIILYFCDDPILATVPAILAALGILLQPWALLWTVLLLIISHLTMRAIIPTDLYYKIDLYITLGSLLLIPLFTAITSIIFYTYLVNRFKLNWPGKLWPYLKSPKGIATILTLACLVAIVCYARYIDFPPLKQGLPPVIKEYAEECHIKQSQANFWHTSNFWDEHYLCRIEAKQEQIVALVKKLEASNICPQRMPADFLRKRPYWWNPPMNEDIKTYEANKKHLYGGYHLLMLYDQQRHVFYIMMDGWNG